MADEQTQEAAQEAITGEAIASSTLQLSSPPVEIVEPLTVVQAPISSKEQAITDAVNLWVVRNIYNSPVSRNTDAINHLHTALPVLIAALTALEV